MPAAWPIAAAPASAVIVVSCPVDGAWKKNMDNQQNETLRQQLLELRIEHRNLDEIIGRLTADPIVDQVQLRRLKKRKLQLKDFIARLESRMIPDLNA